MSKSNTQSVDILLERIWSVEWTKLSPLPPDLLYMAMDYLYEEKKAYRKNGSLSVHYFTFNEVEHGETKLYSSSGNLWEHRNSVYGKPEGEYKRWGLKDPKHLESHGFFVDGNKHGEWIMWDEYSPTVLSETYENGVKEGVHTRWRKNGTIVIQWTYKNGKKHGAYVSMSSDGRPIERGEYNNGEKQGLWEYWIAGLPGGSESPHKREWFNNGIMERMVAYGV